MKRTWLVGLAAVGLLASGSAFAQMSTETTTTTWTVKPEERTVIKDYVVKEKIRPAPIKEEVTIGAAVPADVTLQPVPEEIYTRVPEVRRYQYFDWDGRVVFVDPDSRKVVQIVDLANFIASGACAVRKARPKPGFFWPARRRTLRRRVLRLTLILEK